MWSSLHPSCLHICFLDLYVFFLHQIREVFFYYSVKDFIYLFLESEEGKEKERERNINVWLHFECPILGTWPTTQACALPGNRTSDPLVCRPALNPLTYTSQGPFITFSNRFQIYCSFPSSSPTPMMKMWDLLKLAQRLLILPSFFWIPFSSCCCLICLFPFVPNH